MGVLYQDIGLLLMSFMAGLTLARSSWNGWMVLEPRTDSITSGRRRLVVGAVL